MSQRRGILPMVLAEHINKFGSTKQNIQPPISNKMWHTIQDKYFEYFTQVELAYMFSPAEKHEFESVKAFWIALWPDLEPDSFFIGEDPDPTAQPSKPIDQVPIVILDGKRSTKPPPISPDTSVEPGSPERRKSLPFSKQIGTAPGIMQTIGPQPQLEESFAGAAATMPTKPSDGTVRGGEKLRPKNAIVEDLNTDEFDISQAEEWMDAATAYMTGRATNPPAKKADYWKKRDEPGGS